MKFTNADLPAPMLAALTQAGFTTATPIQAAALAAVRASRDLIALAPTGSGKTLAFGLGVLARLFEDRPSRAALRKGVKPDRLRALVLCPTRELAQQVARDLEAMTRGTILHVGVVFGKTAISPQRELLRQDIDLLVGTPGRVNELIDQGHLSLRAVSTLVIDEADRMVDMGFFPQVSRVLASFETRPQIACFSATLPANVESAVLSLLHEPERFDVGQRNAVVSGEHLGYLVPDEAKVALLLSLHSTEPLRGSVIYTRTRRRAGWVATALSRNGLKVGLIHGDRSQRRREEALAGFAAGTLEVLVATDVAARGLHVPAIARVVNYDLPVMPEDFVHRVGRSGHGVGRSRSVTFHVSEEADRWRVIQSMCGADVVDAKLPEGIMPKSAGRVGSRKQAPTRGGSRPKDPKRVRPSGRRAGTPRTLRGTLRRTKLDPSNRPGGGVRRGPLPGGADRAR